MSFMDKLKRGAAEAGNKAKIVVEINKLKLINVSKQNDISQIYKQIGEKVVGFHAQQTELNYSLFTSELEKIVMLKIEIEQNLQQIANLSDDKQCPSCGASNAIDARVCTTCQQAFPIHVVEAIEDKEHYIELSSDKKDKE